MKVIKQSSKLVLYRITMRFRWGC